MAITPNTFKNLTFGGVNSADYGVYISGEGVYNAPSRAVELTQIPGRNGAIPVDMGYWENIEIVYPCGMFGSDQTDFASNYSDFINAIASQKGYQRLEDTYHTDEFRQALFVSGVETKPIGFGQAGEFELVFNCKPQRFLKSGETAVAISDGDAITNPTPYPASPLLAVEGDGTVEFNGFSVTLDPALYGDIEIANNQYLEPAKSLPTSAAQWVEMLNTSQANTDDDLTVSVGTVCNIPIKSGNTYTSVIQVTPPSSGSSSISFSASDATIYTNLNAFSMKVGQYFAEVTDSAAYKFTYTRAGTSFNMLLTVTIKVLKDTGDGLRIQCGGVWTPDSPSQPQMSQNATIAPIILSAVEDSTKSYLGNPTYVDCELGEAYRIDDGEMTLLNRYIMLGSELPTLAAGSNVFELDNTITDLEVTPRWWKL